MNFIIRIIKVPNFFVSLSHSVKLLQNVLPEEWFAAIRGGVSYLGFLGNGQRTIQSLSERHTALVDISEDISELFVSYILSKYEREISFMAALK